MWNNKTNKLHIFDIIKNTTMNNNTKTYGVRYIHACGLMALCFIKAKSCVDAQKQFRKCHDNVVIKSFIADFS